MAQRKDSSSVTVGVRVRPRNQKEIEAEMPVSFNVSHDGSTVEELDENSMAVKHWSYDHAFGPDCTNKDVFDTMGMKLVDAALEGFNTVMFMYGQTSSGKTFTLFGGNNIAGVVQHAMEHVQLRIKSYNDTEFVIKLTYAELYNEEIKDLLSPTPNENLKIIEDPNIGPLIQNITEATFVSAADVKVLLEEGENRRHFGVTNMNAHSSRSHVIVRLHIESRKVHFKVTNALRSSWGKDKPHCVSTLNLVDLAGSERANKAGTSGQSLKEGSFINKSLLTLGTVIANLSEGKTQHIPYRNSKLTRLLATALGGNAKTSVITCISPASGNVAESLNTLRFASRAKRIVNHVQKNELLDMKSLSNKLSIQMQEIEQLRHQLELSKQLGFSPFEAEAAGESLREKAISASKSMRSFKFFVKQGPRIANALRAQGMTHLAKKVMMDVKLAIGGQREASGMIDEYATLIETYLQKDRKLMESIHRVAMQNEAEAMLSVQDGIAMETEGFDGEDGDEGDDMFEEDEDAFDSLFGGGDEMREKVEIARMATEELRTIAAAKIVLLSTTLHESSQRESLLRRNLDDAQRTLVEKHDTIQMLKTVEVTSQKQIDDLKLQRRQDANASAEMQQQFQARIKELQMTIDEKNEECAQKILDINAKDNDAEGLRNQIEQLTMDINAAIASKKAFEEESSRARSDMRIQMDKLRNNMHKMLLEGGMEAKVIESQNVELQKELDRSRDALDALAKLKDNFENEVTQVRAALAASRDSEKSKLDEIAALRAENADIGQKLRDLRLELVAAHTKVACGEHDNSQLQAQLRSEIALREESLSTQQRDAEVQRAKLVAQLQQQQLEGDKLQQEVASLQDSLQNKAAFVSKMEASFAADVLRIETKLAEKNRLCEELHVENKNNTLQAQQTLHKHHEEIRQLKLKISELQSSLDAIEQFVDVQEQEFAEERIQQQQALRALSAPSADESISGLGRGDYSIVSESMDMHPDSRGGGSYRPPLYVSTSVDEGDWITPPATKASSMVGTPLSAARRNAPGTKSRTTFNLTPLEYPTSVSRTMEPRQVSSQSNDNEVVRDPLDVESLSLDPHRYEQLHYSLALATALWECSMQQSIQLHHHLQHSQDDLRAELLRTNSEFDSQQENEEQLLTTQQQLQSSLRYHQSLQATLQGSIDDLQNQLTRQQADFFRVSKQEKLLAQQASELESTVREQSSLLGKVRQDVQREAEHAREARLDQAQTLGLLEEERERCEILETKCALLREQVDRLQRDKEDALRSLESHLTVASAGSTVFHAPSTLSAPTAPCAPAASPSFIRDRFPSREDIHMGLREDGNKNDFVSYQPGEVERKCNGQSTVEMARSIMKKYRNSNLSAITTDSSGSHSIGSGNQINSSGKSPFLDLYRLHKSENCTAASLSASELEEAKRARLLEPVNTLRTYAMNTGEPVNAHRHRHAQAQAELATNARSSQRSGVLSNRSPIR